MLGYLSYEWTQRLAAIRRPAAVVWGDRDAIIPVGDGEEYARLIPGARSLILPDTGHIPMVERPRTFNRALLDFLADEAAPAGAGATAAGR